MIIRIVKMTFKPGTTDEFIAAFENKKYLIASFRGCTGVKLVRDVANGNIFFTYSQWQNEQALEDYRNSTLFIETWNEVKKLFSDKPEAWSVEQVSAA